MLATPLVLENFWNVGELVRLFCVPLIGFKRGIDLDNCNKSWAASVSSFVRIRCAGSFLDVVSEDGEERIDNDVGG